MYAVGGLRMRGVEAKILSSHAFRYVIIRSGNVGADQYCYELETIRVTNDWKMESQRVR